jgi:peptidoglycan/LPS O-acetylase OafA/YrhL
MTDAIQTLNATEISIPHPSGGGARPLLLKREMPGLDALRGIAVLAVLLYHGLYWDMPGHGGESATLEKLSHVFVFGWLGVNLFFVLSGFLITGILLDTRGRPHYAKNFYVRRALRILPLYIVTLAWFAAQNHTTWGYVAICLLNLANVSRYLPVGGDAYGVFWSLAVEEQFYLVWPWLVRRLSLRWMTYVCIGILVACPILRVISELHWLPLGDGHSMTWLIADNLAIGGLLATFLRTRHATLLNVRWLMSGLLALGVVLLGIGASTHLLHRTTALGAAFQPEPFIVLFSGLLLAALFWGDRRLVLWWTAPLRFLGYISYGLYMLHTLVFQLYDEMPKWTGVVRPKVMSLQAGLTRFTIVFAVSVVICFLSRRYFEDYFLRLKSKLAPNTVAERAKSN